MSSPLLLLLLLLSCLPLISSILPVQENEVREVRELNGLWTFVREPSNSHGIGLEGLWHTRDLSLFTNATVMPVPSAYNDLGDASLRDHIGWVWYQKTVFVPARAAEGRVLLRIDSANYYAQVFINSSPVGSHTGGHLPFEFDITKHLSYGSPNTLSIALNNTISNETVPQGQFQHRTTSNGTQYVVMSPNFDFFHYAGLLRPVRLLFVPSTRVVSVFVDASASGYLDYSHAVTGSATYTVKVSLTDHEGKSVYGSELLNNSVIISKPQLWWPRGMGDPYLYTLTTRLFSSDGSLLDVVSTRLGFRTVTWDKQQIYWNYRPFYCHGFGMHEEADLRGRAFDSVLLAADLSLLEWTGANCFRTSHYPYAEERLAECDRRGIAVIAETPAVGMQSLNSKALKVHLDLLEELIGRDRNHPSVFMWSTANEPSSDAANAREYFKTVIDRARELDPTRPITTVLSVPRSRDKTADMLDVICFNRYNGWYAEIGQLDIIEENFAVELLGWSSMGKPVLVSEYGAESIPGMHREPSFVFTEEYQVDVMKKHFDIFDQLRQQNKLAGEMIWVFADFMTKQDTTRVVGNHKGVFTRQRQPKAAAHLIRKRYHKLLRGHAHDEL